jgi:uncharacterized integral membrane protein
MMSSNPGDGPRPKSDEGRKISGAMIGGVIALIAIVLFIVQNTEDVPINFLWMEFSPPEWVLIVITIVLTLIVERTIGYVWRRRRKQRAVTKPA